MSSNGQVSVVVTGLGATTPLGGDVASTWSAMLAGTSGVRRLTDSWVDSLPVKIAATAAVDPVAVVGRVQARKMDRCEQFALVAAREAWADAGSPEVEPYRLGVAVSSGIGLCRTHVWWATGGDSTDRATTRRPGGHPVGSCVGGSDRVRGARFTTCLRPLPSLARAHSSVG